MARIQLVVLCLTGTFLARVAPAAAEELPTRYARGDIGQAVEMLWLDFRAGRALDGGAVGVDLGLYGSPTGRGAVGMTGGLEVRGAVGKRVSPFGRVELGAMLLSQDQVYAVVSLGGGLAVKIDRSWSLRAGLLYSLHVGDSIHGPDRAFVGFERRW